ncbi:LysR substrate-binding domain-containing protein (plasmid) [Rhizobium leguminosarum]
MLAHTNEDVKRLNEALRSVMVGEGTLGENRAFRTERGAREFAAGDRIIFLENARFVEPRAMRLGPQHVKNGMLGTVVSTGDKRGDAVLSVRLDSGRDVVISESSYRNVDHGYAATIHKSQGATVERTFVLATGMMDHFAACWLVSRLPEFRELHPEIDVTIDSDPRLVEFRSGRAEIAIRHSASVTAWPRTESEHLADVSMIAVAASALLEAGPAIKRPDDILRHTLLHEENRDVWSRWFEAAGMAMPETARGPVYADGGLVMQAVLRGQGIALMDEIFAEDEIKAGRLLRLFDLAIPLGAYWLVARRFDRLTPPASLFVRWIRSRIEVS